MPVAHRNFEYSYLSPKGKPIFVPSSEGRDWGHRIKDLIEGLHTFEAYYFHLRRGSHVAALHEHRENSWFARIDLQNFFHTVTRSRLDRTLQASGVRSHRLFAKWSTVKDPFGGTGYVLPYGFVQSPILSTLCLSQSSIGTVLKRLSCSMTVSVYLDDIAVSAASETMVRKAYDELCQAVHNSGFLLSSKKSESESKAITLFNCELRFGYSAVLQSQKDESNSMPKSGRSLDAFERYCQSVETGNRS